MTPQHHLPADIERTSLSIITAELDAMGLTPPPETAAVVKRVIHTTADFDYARNLRFTPGAVAAGVAALMLSTGDLAEIASAARQLDTALDGHGRETLKLCAVALLAEFAADICHDAGEAALSKRIEVGVKIGVTAAALPLASQVLESISALISHLS